MAGLLERIPEVGAGLAESDPLTRGWTAFAKSYFLFLIEPRPWQAFQVAEQGMRDFREIGSERNALILQTLSGLALGRLGECPPPWSGCARCWPTPGGRSSTSPWPMVSITWPWCCPPAASRRTGRRPAPCSGSTWGGGAPVLPVELRARDAGEDGRAHRGSCTRRETRARQACELLAPFLSYLTLARAILGSILLCPGARRGGPAGGGARGEGRGADGLRGGVRGGHAPGAGGGLFRGG